MLICIVIDCFLRSHSVLCFVYYFVICAVFFRQLSDSLFFLACKDLGAEPSMHNEHKDTTSSETKHTTSQVDSTSSHRSQDDAGADAAPRSDPKSKYPLISNRACCINLLAILTPFLTFVVAYAISISNGIVRYPSFFLSWAIDFPPTSNIGAFG